MKARISEIGDPKLNLPESNTVLESQYNRINDEIDKYSIYSLQESHVDETVSSITKILTELQKLAQEMSAIDCKTQSAEYRTLRERFLDVDNKLGNLMGSSLYRFRDVDMNVFGEIFEKSRYKLQNDQDSAAVCSQLKGLLTNPATITKVSNALNQLQARVTESARIVNKNKETANSLLSLLRQRRDAIQGKLASLTPQQQVTNQLPVIMLVIGGSSVLTMIIVRLFSEPIQMEWVASGQVIQFVTVMILLSAIMALGLSGILKENTLGTLLGGLAGYILAQGVGRAAARDATRRAGGGHMATGNQLHVSQTPTGRHVTQDRHPTPETKQAITGEQ